MLKILHVLLHRSSKSSPLSLRLVIAKNHFTQMDYEPLNCNILLLQATTLKTVCIIDSYHLYLYETDGMNGKILSCLATPSFL